MASMYYSLATHQDGRTSDNPKGSLKCPKRDKRMAAGLCQAGWLLVYVGMIPCGNL